MHWLKKILNQAQQSSQTPLNIPKYPNFHAPTAFYPTIHFAVKVPNLPAPFHYFNFLAMIGHINNQAFEKSACIKKPNQHATTFSSISSSMVGHLHEYDVQRQCEFSATSFNFDQREILRGKFPSFHLSRQDTELSFELDIQTSKVVSYFTQVKLRFAEHWSALAYCKGEVRSKNHTICIDQMATFEYARISKWLYVPYAFYCYQLINIDQHRQLILLQTRAVHNQIISSKAYLRSHLDQSTMTFLDVTFCIHRVYPQVKTLNNKKIYLPREFEWHGQNHEGQRFKLIGLSRGDYKFGFGTGFIGSFSYELILNNETISGQSAYCEYIDQRLLKWQEHQDPNEIFDEYSKTVPIMLKKP